MTDPQDIYFEAALDVPPTAEDAKRFRDWLNGPIFPPITAEAIQKRIDEYLDRVLARGDELLEEEAQDGNTYAN